MSNSHRSHRRRKKRGAGKRGAGKRGAGRLGLAGALTGVVGIAAVAGGILVIRHNADDGGPARPSLASQGHGGGPGGLATAAPPKGGPAQSFSTPEGYGYDLSAVRAGTDARPLSGSTPPPSGSSYAYADYVLTNNQRRPVLLDFPADLFMPLSQVPDSARERCMPQPGVPDRMCTLPNHSQVTARLNGAEAPVEEDGEKLMPAGASYVVRIAADLPVKDGLDAGDLKLYVWDARFTSDRKGVEIAFP